MLVFRFGLETIQKFEWDGNQKYGSNGAPESSNLYKQQGVSLCCWLILCTFVNNQTRGIILSNHFPLHVASDKW